MLNVKLFEMQNFLPADPCPVQKSVIYSRCKIVFPSKI